jgi:hypothetical protein
MNRVEREREKKRTNGIQINQEKEKNKMIGIGNIC